jgi:hypothetical protein
VLAVGVGVLQEVAQNAVRLAAAARPAKENLKDRAAISDLISKGVLAI